MSGTTLSVSGDCLSHPFLLLGLSPRHYSVHVSFSGHLWIYAKFILRFWVTCLLKVFHFLDFYICSSFSILELYYLLTILGKTMIFFVILVIVVWKYSESGKRQTCLFYCSFSRENFLSLLSALGAFTNIFKYVIYSCSDFIIIDTRVHVTVSLYFIIFHYSWHCLYLMFEKHSTTWN